MELNILKLVLDRSGRIVDSKNLALNQCSSNNRIEVYYEGEYDYILMSFRKPDGWLSDRRPLKFDVDDEGIQYAYYDIPEDITTFLLGGRNGILTGNIYLYKTINGEAKVSTLGNIRIAVRCVDGADINTDVSRNQMLDIYSRFAAIEQDLNRFETGDVVVSRAVSDQNGKPIDIYYETKADALDKYDDLNQKKLDKTEIAEQTSRIEVLETTSSVSNNRLDTLESELSTQDIQIDTNTSNIETLNITKVSNEEFDERINERISVELNLQKQIDDIATSQNVKDIVGSRAELFAYNTSNLNDGDRIQVLTDAAYDNLSTIYRWDLQTKSWIYVGKYSSTSYSRTETDKLINNVKNTVPNKIIPSNNKLYLYKDSIQISGQTSPVEFKTIDGYSILGSGNISTDRTDAFLSLGSTNPVQNKIITGALNNKANTADLLTLESRVDEKADIQELDKKQNKLTAGANVTISEDGVISVSSLIKFKKVESLPDIGETNIIYLLKSTEAEYTEYIWVDDKWEALGDARLSLENYYTAAQINELIAERAYQEDLVSLSGRVSANTVSLASKADAASTSSSISLLTSGINTLNAGLIVKADKEELQKYALRSEVPNIDTKQDKLVSGENIKTINGINILGSGDLLIADTEIVDLGNYVLKTENESALSLKADKTELFNKDYNSLTNLPDLDNFATHSEVFTLKDYVDESIEAIPPVDLSGYYTKDEVDTAIENVDVSEELANYYTKEEVDTAISTHTPDLTGYATEEWVRRDFITTANASSIFAVKSDIPTVPGNLSAFNNDTGYATVEYVDKEISDLIGTAPETFDTLKEIADYIESDQTSTATMISDINKNKSDISTAKTNISNNSSRISELQGQLGNKILFKNWTV